MQTFRILFFLLILLLTSNQGVFAASALFVATSGEDFAHPHDLVLGPDGKQLYVTDMNHDVIKILHPLTLEIMDKIGVDQLSSPHDITFDNLGRILVADSGNDRIAIFDPSGTLQDEIAGNMRSPEGVTTAPGHIVFVASTGNHRILKFKNNKLLKQVGGRGKRELEFKRPHDIELGPDGLLYIGDPGNNRIQVLTQELTFARFITPGDRKFDEPKYLALDTDSNLYVADQHNNLLRVFNTKGQELWHIAQGGNKALNYIEGVEVVGNTLWISDTYNDRILRYSLK